VARLAARLSRTFFRFSSRFSVSSMRTVRNFRTMSDTRKRRSNSFTISGPALNWNSTYAPSRYLAHPVRQPALAPLVDFVYRAPAVVNWVRNCSTNWSTSYPAHPVSL